MTMSGAMIIMMVLMMGAMLVGAGAALWTRARRRIKQGRERKP
jgi:hypothetical protein